MPIRTNTVDLDSEMERLQDERDDLAATVADLAQGNPKREELVQRGTEIDAYLDGLAAVTDPPGDVDIPEMHSVTLGGLTGGEYGQVEDELVGAARDRGDGSLGSGAMRVHMVAKGTLDAPYLDDADSYQEEVAATAQLPLGYLKWAESKVDNLTSVGGNGQQSFADLVEAKQTNGSSPEN